MVPAASGIAPPFSFGGGAATVVASCVDVTDTGIDIAEYRPHAIVVNP